MPPWLWLWLIGDLAVLIPAEISNERLSSSFPGSQGRVNSYRQAPEATEIRAQEEVRTQDDEIRADRGAGDDRIQEALETAAEVAEKTGGLGTPGRPVNRRSPFMIGLTGALGVAVAYGLIELFLRARSVLILIGLALFVAAGLDPVVGWLVRHRMPRWAAVLTVIGCALAIVAAFLAAAIPPLASEATALAHQIPHYMHTLQDRNSQLGKLNVKYHIQQRLSTGHRRGQLPDRRGPRRRGPSAQHRLLHPRGAGAQHLFPGRPAQIKVFAYRLVPHSRRPRAILIGDEILAKVGGYVLGNFITSVIAALAPSSGCSRSASPIRSCLASSWPSST